MTKPRIIGTKLANGLIRTIATTVLAVRTRLLYTCAQVSYILSGGPRHGKTRNDNLAAVRQAQKTIDISSGLW
jgi:hypothetical protein